MCCTEVPTCDRRSRPGPDRGGPSRSRVLMRKTQVMSGLKSKGHWGLHLRPETWSIFSLKCVKNGILKNQTFFKTETIRSETEKSKLTKTETTIGKSSLHCNSWGDCGKSSPITFEVDDAVDNFSYQFYRNRLPENHRSPCIVTNSSSIRISLIVDNSFLSIVLPATKDSRKKIFSTLILFCSRLI